MENYLKSRKVFFDEQQKTEIDHDIHKGIGENARSKAMASHRGIPVPADVMKQIGIDICNLPEVDGYRHLIVCIDYFSKWSEAKATKDKSTPTVAQFIYDIICRHGRVKIQINDQGKEFVNEVSKNLLEMTGTEQRVTSAYHPQYKDLCERQNRTIKDSMVKVLEEKPKEWPSIIEGILLAHRVSVHYSTKYSPFFLMYNRHPVLPIDIKYELIDGTANNDSESDPFDIETFQLYLIQQHQLEKPHTIRPA